MFVCNNPQFIFIDIPKTGSRSIFKYLLGNFKNGQKTGNHQLTIPPKSKTWFSFCVVRNPYDRMCSLYWSTSKRANNADKDRYGYLGEMKKNKMENNLLNFCKIVEKRYRRGNPNNAFRSLQFMHVVPQHVYIEHNNFNTILRFENLEKDFNQLPFITKHVELPHENTTQELRPHWTEMMDDPTIAQINKMYAKEFDMFGYEKL